MPWYELDGRKPESRSAEHFVAPNAMVIGSVSLEHQSSVWFNAVLRGDDEQITVRQPDILILEGLNVLQTGSRSDGAATEFVSDYFDFSIYIDADEPTIEEFYVQRFLTLCETVFQNPDSFFRNYAHLSRDEAIETARFIWREINGRNLRENILPTKDRAGLVLRKGPDHHVTDVILRRL